MGDIINDSSLNHLLNIKSDKLEEHPIYQAILATKIFKVTFSDYCEYAQFRIQKMPYVPMVLVLSLDYRENDRYLRLYLESPDNGFRIINFNEAIPLLSKEQLNGILYHLDLFSQV